MKHPDIYNPCQITFGANSFAKTAGLIDGRRYGVVTYPEPYFAGLVTRLSADAGPPTLVIDDVAPNPDFALLTRQAAGIGEQPEIFVALGGGSVIDTAKVLASANGDFAHVRAFLTTKSGEDALSATPIIAVPTTAGTGSDVTCWATVWDNSAKQKHSLNRPELYPEHAVVDPTLMLGKSMLGKSRDLTISTGLDALSHALESLWNINATAGSASHAVKAASLIMATLPKVLTDLVSLNLRTDMALASLNAGLAFSQTKTAIAHSVSYPISLNHGVVHGIACSFTLPIVLQVMAQDTGPCGQALRQIFGADLSKAPKIMQDFLASVGVSSRPVDHGVSADLWRVYVDAAFEGERGLNFVGSRGAFHRAVAALGLV